MQHTPSQSAWIAASSARLDVQVAHGTGGDARQEALADAGQQLGGDGGQEGQELPEQLGGTGGDLGGAAALHAHHAVGACVACAVPTLIPVRNGPVTIVPLAQGNPLRGKDITYFVRMW